MHWHSRLSLGSNRALLRKKVFPPSTSARLLVWNYSLQNASKVFSGNWKHPLKNAFWTPIQPIKCPGVLEGSGAWSMIAWGCYILVRLFYKISELGHNFKQWIDRLPQYYRVLYQDNNIIPCSHLLKMVLVRLKGREMNIVILIWKGWRLFRNEG